MKKINFENGTLVSPAKVNENNTITPAVWEGNTPISAHTLNLLQNNVEKGMDTLENNIGENINTLHRSIENNINTKQLETKSYIDNKTIAGINLDKNITANALATSLKIEMGKLMHPVGSIYIGINNTNPNLILGFGTWELIRNYYGGELLSVATVWTNEPGTLISSNTSKSFSDNSVGGGQLSSINDFGLDILRHESGTINVYTRGIVGFVESELTMSGYANTGNVALWWSGNENNLPAGVELMQNHDTMAITKCSNEHEYGGVTNSLYYKVSTNDDIKFFVNPQFTVYSGNFTPGQGGTKCILKVKAYARSGKNYMWKRIA